MIRWRWGVAAVVLSLGSLAGGSAEAATSFNEQFADGILDPAIQSFKTTPTTSTFLIEPGAHFGGLVGKRSAGTLEGDSLVGLITNDADYSTADWTARAVLWRTPANYGGNGTGDILLFGVGNTVGWGGDVLSNAITSRAHVGWNPVNWGWQYRYDMFGWSSSGTAIEQNSLPTGSYGGGDNQEIALSMTKTGTSLLYEIDHNNDGSVEYTHTFDLSNAGYDWYDSSNSQIYIAFRRSGGTELASFSVSAVPEPSSVALAGLGLLGLCGWGLRRRGCK